jgi:excisionase family DNA binding protein
MAVVNSMERQQEAALSRQQEALLWDAKLVAKALSVGQRTLWRWIAAGTFPAPDLSIGAKVRRWKRETVLDWIQKNTA